MNREEALGGLFSPQQQVRLMAARALCEVALPVDLVAIRLARSVETVPWVRSALARAAAKLEGRPLPSRDDVVATELQADEDLEGRVRSETIGQLIHELSPAVGRLKMAAMTTCREYAGSKLEKEFEKLTQLIDLFGRWRRISAPPRFSDVVLSDLLHEVVDDESKDGISVVIADGPRSRNIITDREFLRAAVANGLRNAIEAVEAKAQARTGGEFVTVSYGVTDREFWIAIHDEGVGLPEGEQIFAATSTTKPGHSGLGLPLALEAVKKLGGRLSLTPVSRGGAKFLIEIPLAVDKE